MSPHGFLAGFLAAPLARWPNDLREMQRSLGSGLQPFGADLGAVEANYPLGFGIREVGDGD